ncbi:NYN domain-containing protein [Nocardioides aequoreus]|uniref:NYN domain-containing protein n=1 Tax=Nocardioides aequoreus TaxID=397278 RepID=UPI0004C419BA|nr:NYN domain-containing protein [Nocardioides aequoreus]
MSDPRLSVLIDADNVSPKHATELFAELAGYGNLTVRRAYGDWTTDQLGGWKKRLHEHAISPMQQFAYTQGKNSTDSALIIDAMDLLYAGNLDGFVIVSSDSDFTRLATRLRESGMTVYGLGAKKTPKAFRDACDQFVYLENLGDTEPDPVAEPEVSEPANPDDTEPSEGSGRRPEAALQSKLARALNRVDADDDDWATLSSVGDVLRRTDPSFDPRTFGFGKLSDLVKAQRFVETRTVTGEKGRGELWVRLKGRRGRNGS